MTVKIADTSHYNSLDEHQPTHVTVPPQRTTLLIFATQIRKNKTIYKKTIALEFWPDTLITI